MRFRFTELFETFPIDFATPFPVFLTGERYLVIADQHQIGWLIARATKYNMSDEVLQSLLEAIIFCLGQPKMIITDDGRCFTANKTQRFMKECKIVQKRSWNSLWCQMSELSEWLVLSTTFDENVDSSVNIPEVASLNYSNKSCALWVPNKNQVWPANFFPANVRSPSENEWRRALLDVRNSRQFIASTIIDGTDPIVESAKKQTIKPAVEMETRAMRTEVWSWRQSVSCKGKISQCSVEKRFSIQVVRILSSCCSKSSLVWAPHN